MDYETRVILTRLQIRRIAQGFRKMFNVASLRFPVIKVLDLLVVKFDGNLTYSIEEDSSFDTNVMAELQSNGDGRYNIRIRQSVFDKATSGDRASIGYICHEMCHYLLIGVLDIGPKLYQATDGMVYTKSINSNDMPLYKSMEWQAKALCGEVMIPYEECKALSLSEIVDKTQSSTEQAKYFIKYVANNIEE